VGDSAGTEQMPSLCVTLRLLAKFLTSCLVQVVCPIEHRWASKADGTLLRRHFDDCGRKRDSTAVHGHLQQ